MDRRTARFIICSIVSFVAVVAAAGGMAVDTVVVVDSMSPDSSVVNIIEDASATGTASVVAPVSSRVRVLLVDGKYNIESVEADYSDGDFDEKPSLILGNDSPKGLGFIIPGAVFTMIGVNAIAILLDERSGSKTPETYDGAVAAGSLLSAWSITSLTIGIHQLRHHIRINKRYYMNERKRTVTPPAAGAARIAVRKSRK